jgi:predicted CxxxxCH...CXXCH cytochrome family protein
MDVTGVSCADCHTGYTQATTAGAGHRDGNIDTAVALGYTQNKAIASAFETCATASCHDNGLGNAVASPVWGASVTDCSECHLTQPGTGSHSIHLADGATCGNCHNNAVQGTTAPALHGNNLVDVYDVNPGDLGYPQGVAKGIGSWTTCNSTSCHNDGQSGLDTDLGNVGASNVTTPKWGTSSVCAACHVATPSSAKHDEHLGSYGSTCGDCHAGAVADSDGGTNHRDGLISVGSKAIYSAGGTPGNGWGSCTNSAVGCHPGSTRNWDATGPSCNSCHGASGNGNGAPLIAGDMISTNPVGQHATHATATGYGYACAVCHTGGHNETAGMTGQDDTLQISFTGTLAAGGSYNPPGTWTTGKWLYSQSSTTTTQDCSNLYCHSSGQSADGSSATPVYATPSWGDAASGACGTCHAASPATGSHAEHLAASATCNDCHSGNNHVDKVIDVTSVTYTAAGAPGNGYGTCSTASCHDNGTGTVVPTPTWGTDANCNACHAASPTTNSHPIHLALAAVTCDTCHAGSTHNGTIDTVAGLGYDDTTKGAPYGSCATASCHDSGLGTPAPTPLWGTDVTDCSTCHAKAPATGSHSVHFADSAACSVCHATAIEGTSISATNHNNGFVNIDGTPLNGYANNPAALGNASWTTCSTASCHVTGQAANDYAVTPDWGVDAANCSQCHLASPTTGSHAKHITATGDCATCHTGAIKDSSYSAAAHRDDNVDVSVGGYTANKALGSAYETCSISCHSDGMTAVATSPTWGTVVTGCAACHESDMTTGSHTVHLAASATCGDCHDGAIKDTNAGTAHTDTNVDVIAGYATLNAPYGSGSWTTCNAASCHDDGTGTLVTTPDWGTTSTCNECHAASPTTNAHGKHLALSGVTCDTCHAGATHNGSIDTVAGLGYADTSKGAPYVSCATASCHNNGLGATVASPAWNGSANCSSCHTTPPTTGSHSIHLSNGSTCSSCHSNATPTTVATGVHANDNVEVFNTTAGDLGYPTTAALGSASWATCDNASCHDNGTGTLVTTPKWGDSAACTECHTTVPATGAHSKHLNQTISASITCTTCHTGTVWGSTAPTTGHRDGDIDVTGGYGYPLNKTKNTAYASCNNTYCHGEDMPNGATGTTNAPSWGATSTGCGFCHAMAPATVAAHSGKTASDCITCHDNTNAAGDGFVDATLHINGTVEGGGDSCLDCHSNVGSGLSGAHAAHNTVPFAGLLSNGDYGSTAAGWYNVTYTNGVPSFGCGFCHPATVAGHMTTQVSLNPADAGAAGTLKARNSAGAAYNAVAGTCSATYCHSDGVNVAGSVTPAWNTTISGNCTDCHGNSPTTNAHSVHSVGIHYTDLYDSSRNGVMQAAAATNAAHGNSATSTTITCVICHGDTVSLTQNDQNDVCTTCHNGASTKGNLGINTLKATHINGQPDVVFNLSGFKTTAQLRDDITGVTELNNNWTRTNGYKDAVTGTSHDAAKAVTPGFTAGSCSAIVCHNGNSANWTDPVANDCQKCHTALPQ